MNMSTTEMRERIAEASPRLKARIAVAGGPQTTGNRVLIAGTLKGCLRTRLKEWWHPFRVQTD